MGIESQVEIPEGSGNYYRYEYDESSGKTLYRGPVGSAPELGETEFLAAVTKSRKLQRAVEKFINEKREWHEEAGLNDPFVDLKITDQYSYVYSTTDFRTGEVSYHSKDAGAELYVIYDGSAYDYFRPGSPFHYNEQLEEVAKKNGYITEQVDNVTIGFYPE